MRVLLILAILVALFYFATKSERATSTQASAICASNMTALADFLTKAEQLGVIRSASRYEVNERDWNALEHKLKVTLALAAFCNQVGSAGRGVTILYGLHDGEQKASVVDGNYSD